VSKKFVVSPSFGEFRSGEPVAYELANEAVRVMGSNFEAKVVCSGKNCGVVYGRGDKVVVAFNGMSNEYFSDKPFYFDVEEA
jgi:hypothetical protein